MLSLIQHSKVLSRPRLLRRCAILRKQGNTIVFTNGCFDLLHYGHVRYLQQAKQRGDILVVGVNSDRSVQRLKGPSRPLVPERERAAVLAALACIDYVTIFNENTPGRVISLLQPDILIKGADWHNGAIVGADVVRARGGRVIRMPLVKGRSTSNLIHEILKKCRPAKRNSSSG